MSESKKIAVLLIDEPPLPIREAMDEVKLKNLAEDMRLRGQLQDIGVVQRKKRYEIRFGHRRYLAARMLGWVEIACKVYDRDSEELKGAMWAENALKENMTAAEEGRWFLETIEKEGIDTDQLAARIGKSRNYVEERIIVRQGDPAVLKAIQERKINFTAARLINSVEDGAMRTYFLDLAVRIGYNSRQLDQHIRNWRLQANGQTIPEMVPSDLPPAQVQTVQEDGCVLCGGTKDRYNMRYVLIHHQCADRIEAIVREAAEGAK